MLNVLLFHMLHFILNSSAYAWFPTWTTVQAYKNMATSEVIATYIATTRQRVKEIAIRSMIVSSTW